MKPTSARDAGKALWTLRKWRLWSRHDIRLADLPPAVLLSRLGRGVDPELPVGPHLFPLPQVKLSTGHGMPQVSFTVAGVERFLFDPFQGERQRSLHKSRAAHAELSRSAVDPLQQIVVDRDSDCLHSCVIIRPREPPVQQPSGPCSKAVFQCPERLSLGCPQHRHTYDVPPAPMNDHAFIAHLAVRRVLGTFETKMKDVCIRVVVD